jgi:hypothetical protein
MYKLQTKKILIYSLFIFFAFFGWAKSTWAYNWSGILDPSRAIDWSQSGIPGGIPTTRTQCGNTILSTGSDQTSAIQSALNNCGSGHYVQLGSGSFAVTSLTIPSNVTLRGSGTQSTILRSGSNGVIMMGTDVNNVSTNLINITNGATAGSQSITVANASGISVGGYLMVTELNNSSAPWYATNVGGEGTCTWCDQWNGTRARGQIVEVTSVNGTTIGITPLYSDYTLTPAVTPFSASAKNAGLENLQIYMTAASYGGDMIANIEMKSCMYCWVKGVEDNYANGDHVQIAGSFRDEIRDSYFSNALNHTSGQTESGIFFISKTSGLLFENNIVERAHGSLIANWGTAGNVLAYNYLFGAFDTNYTTNSGWDMCSHGAHPQFNLYEGNVGDMVVVDSIWGSGSHASFYRNWMSGLTARCSPLANGRNNTSCASPNYASTQMGAFMITGLHHSYNIVGNVAGSALAKSQSTEVAEQIGGDPNWNQVIDFELGVGPSDTKTLTTSLVFGNYRNADNNLTWERNVPSGYNPAHPSQTLPASFYLSSKPSWWGNLPWPAIGPDITGGTGPGGHASLTASNPAQACYNNTPKGSDGIALFNPSNCYGSGGSSDTTPPAAPRNVKVN